MSESEKETISFYLSKSLIKDLDKAARSVGKNRSEFLEWLLTRSLPISKRLAKALEEVDAAINEALNVGFTAYKEPEDVAT